MSDDKDFGPVTEAELDAARVSLRPPGGAAPQDPAVVFAGWLRDGYTWRETPLDGYGSEVLRDAIEWLRRAPPDAGRDAGGAATQEAVHDALTTVGAYHLAGAVLLADRAAWEALCAALTGGRPAAEPPDVREGVARLRAALANLVSAHDGYRQGLGPCVCAAHEDARAALGAAPPTPEDRQPAYDAARNAARKLGFTYGALNVAPIVDAAIDALRGAPAEPGERYAGPERRKKWSDYRDAPGLRERRRVAEPGERESET